MRMCASACVHLRECVCARVNERGCVCVRVCLCAIKVITDVTNINSLAPLHLNTLSKTVNNEGGLDYILKENNVGIFDEITGPHPLRQCSVNMVVELYTVLYLMCILRLKYCGVFVDIYIYIEI